MSQEQSIIQATHQELTGKALSEISSAGQKESKSSASANARHPLQTNWTFWYVQRQ